MKKIAIAILLVLFPLTALAIPPEPMVFTAKSVKGNKKKIADGIEKTISDMSFITKPIARGKLEDSNLAFRKISITVNDGKVSIQHDARKPVVSPVDGGKVKWVREDGESFQISQKVGEQKITQIFYAESGKKTLVYKFDKEFNQLWVSVRLDSPKLDLPLRYTMSYKKN